jgi:hypothetical protein
MPAIAEIHAAGGIHCRVNGSSRDNGIVKNVNSDSTHATAGSKFGTPATALKPSIAMTTETRHFKLLKNVEKPSI